MSDYNDLKCLAELACPGPWMQENDDLYFDDDGYTRHLMFTDSGHDVCDDECCDSGHRDNLKFIAAANPAAVLAMIAENRRLSEIIEKLTPQAELYQQVQIAAGSLPSAWEISIRVENGCGSVDLIDPYGTVVDLDNVDETLGESVASAVDFAIDHDISSPENPS